MIKHLGGKKIRRLAPKIGLTQKTWVADKVILQKE